MESPFYPNGITGKNQSFVMYLTPIYDSQTQTYMNIITLSCMPDGPLGSLVKLKSFPKLSIFSTNGNGNGNNNINSTNCAFVLQRYYSSKSTNEYMFADDITAIFSYLTNNGYTIEKSISKMLNESRVVIGSNGTNGNRSMICIASFV